MKTGNAILTAFFIWLAMDLPIKIFTISEAYFIGDFAGIKRDEWMIISFLLPFIFAVIFAIHGKEKNEKNVYYKKPDEEQKEEKPALPDLKAVEIKKEKQESVSDINDHVDELLNKKKEKAPHE